MIHLEHVTKTFKTKDGDVHAVKDVSLNIEEGEIYGIIGFSGAGKSTLVRCINLLEKPDSGAVVFGDKDLLKLSDADLRKEREKTIKYIYRNKFIKITHTLSIGDFYENA